MTDAIKMSLACAIMLTIAVPVWSQETDSDLQEKAQLTVESAGDGRFGCRGR